MHAFYFGTSDRQLFGIYREPATGHGRSGVVLCYPWGQEYLRAHRAFRFLSGLLSGAGLHVLRFDYWGTGDSGGDLGEGGEPSWVSDIVAAAQELMDMADLRRVSLCGLRMGACWAAEAAHQLRDAERLVLWDPVVDGARYVEDLMGRAVRENGRTEVDGFTLTEAVRAALGTCSSEALKRLRPPALVVQTTEQPEVDALLAAVSADTERISSRILPGPSAWEEEVGDFGTSGMPVQTLHGIVEWLSST